MTIDPRDFPHPLSVFLRVLAREEGAWASTTGSSRYADGSYGYRLLRFRAGEAG